MTPRTYTVTADTAHNGSQIGLAHRSYRVWKLRTDGDGHWCTGPGEGRYAREADARRAGELWVETGLQPCEQTPDRIARRRAALAGAGQREAA